VAGIIRLLQLDGCLALSSCRVSPVPATPPFNSNETHPVDYDVAKVRRAALAINPHLRIFEVSCRTGEGLDAWCAWLTAFARAEPEA